MRKNGDLLKGHATKKRVIQKGKNSVHNDASSVPFRTSSVIFMDVIWWLQWLKDWTESEIIVCDFGQK